VSVKAEFEQGANLAGPTNDTETTVPPVPGPTTEGDGTVQDQKAPEADAVTDTEVVTPPANGESQVTNEDGTVVTNPNASR
jgi:hypothetical protein